MPWYNKFQGLYLYIILHYTHLTYFPVPDWPFNIMKGRCKLSIQHTNYRTANNSEMNLTSKCSTNRQQREFWNNLRRISNLILKYEIKIVLTYRGSVSRNRVGRPLETKQSFVIAIWMHCIGMFQVSVKKHSYGPIRWEIKAAVVNKVSVVHSY